MCVRPDKQVITDPEALAKDILSPSPSLSLSTSLPPSLPPTRMFACDYLSPKSDQGSLHCHGFMCFTYWNQTSVCLCLGTSRFKATKYNSRRSLNQLTLVGIAQNAFPLMVIYGLKMSALTVWMCVKTGVTNQIIRSDNEHNIKCARNNMRGCELNVWLEKDKLTLATEHKKHRTVGTQRHWDTIKLDTISSGISHNHVHVIYPAVLVHLFPLSNMT